MDPTAKIAAHWNIPVIGYVSTGKNLANKEEFPTLARVSLTMDEHGKATVEFLQVSNFSNCLSLSFSPTLYAYYRHYHLAWPSGLQ